MLVGEHPLGRFEAGGRAFGALPDSPRGEHVDGGGVEVDAAAGASGLAAAGADLWGDVWGLDDLVGDVDPASVDRDRRGPLVEVVPLEPEEFAASHARERGGPDRWEVAVSGGVAQEGGQLVGGPGLLLLRRSDEGEVTIAGAPSAALSERRRTGLRREHIAFIYQSANLLPSLTALEQLQLVGHIRGRRASSTRAQAHALLDGLGLADRSHQLPAQLSGGERQRVGIARALMAEPAVLVADEPTASLDPTRAESVIDLIVEAEHDREIATVVVAHDDIALRRADRHLRLESGTLRSPTPHR